MRVLNIFAFAALCGKAHGFAFAPTSRKAPCSHPPTKMLGLLDDMLGGLGLGPKGAAEEGLTGATNEVVSVVEGIRQKRLGDSGLVVSEIGLGTQRWGSADFNAPDEEECFKLMDRAILQGGINLIDTAEQVWRARLGT